MGKALDTQTRAQEQKVTFGAKAWSASSEALPGVRSLCHQVILMSFVWGNSVESAYGKQGERTFMSQMNLHGHALVNLPWDKQQSHSSGNGLLSLPSS